MPRRAPRVVLEAQDRAELERRVRARTSRPQDLLRAGIVLLAGHGLTATALAATLGIARGPARAWRARVVALGLAGLADRPQRPPPFGILPRWSGPAIQARIVGLARPAPTDRGWPGQRPWTRKDLATVSGEHPEWGLGRPSKGTVHTIRQAHDVCLDRR